MVSGSILEMTQRLQVCHVLPETRDVAGLSVLSVAASSPWRSVRARPWKSTSRCAPGGERPHRLQWLQLFHGLNSIRTLSFSLGPCLVTFGVQCHIRNGCSASQQLPLPQEQVEALKSGRKKAEKARPSWERHFLPVSTTMHSWKKQAPGNDLCFTDVRFLFRCWYHLSIHNLFLEMLLPAYFWYAKSSGLVAPLESSLLALVSSTVEPFRKPRSAALGCFVAWGW